MVVHSRINITTASIDGVILVYLIHHLTSFYSDFFLIGGRTGEVKGQFYINKSAYNGDLRYTTTSIAFVDITAGPRPPPLPLPTLHSILASY